MISGKQTFAKCSQFSENSAELLSITTPFFAILEASMVDHSPVTLASTIDSGNELQGGHNFEPQSAAAGTESPTDLCTHDRTRLRKGSASIFQNIMLYDVVCKYEVGLREYLRRRPELWESVMFFDHHNKRTLGDVVRIHEPTPDEPTRFDIEESIPGSKDEVRLYSHVNCNRVERRRKYLACDPDWLAYAARTTGSEENEVKRNRISWGGRGTHHCYYFELPLHRSRCGSGSWRRRLSVCLAHPTSAKSQRTSRPVVLSPFLSCQSPGDAHRAKLLRVNKTIRLGGLFPPLLLVFFCEFQRELIKLQGPQHFAH